MKKYNLIVVVGDPSLVRTVREAADLGRPANIVSLCSWRFLFWEIASKAEAVKIARQLARTQVPLIVTVSLLDEHRDVFKCIRRPAKVTKA